MRVSTSNDYEVRVGSFRNAVNPGIGTFREFPGFVRFAREGTHLRLHKIMNGFLPHVLFFVQFKIHIFLYICPSQRDDLIRFHLRFDDIGHPAHNPNLYLFD